MKKVLIFALVVMVLFSMVGCIEVVEGVPQEEYDALKEKYDAVVSERDALLQGVTDVYEETEEPQETETTKIEEETDKPSETDAPIDTGKTPESTSNTIEQTPTISEKEILFRGIPWGTSSGEVKSIIETDENAYVFISKDTMMSTVDHLFDIDYYSILPNAGNILYGHNLIVAGYDISLVSLNFMYKVNDGKVNRNIDELYSAVYELDTTDHETVYLALKQKLSDLYGEGNEVELLRKGWIVAQDYSGEYKYKIVDVTWNGANNTFVTLRWTSSGNEAVSVQEGCGIKIAYGKSDANEKLKTLHDAIIKEQKEEDQNKAQSSNNEGL